MNIVDFSNWLSFKGTNKKIISDTISRLKRINNELITLDPCTNIEKEYKTDKCKNLFDSFNRKLPNNIKILASSCLPLDKPEISNYKLALNKYIDFLEKKDSPQ